MKDYLTTIIKTLDEIPHNTVVLASFLNEAGIPHKIQHNYKKKAWLNPIGQGAFLKFKDEKASFEGAVYSLQKQAKLKIHIGGLSALILNGYSHYVRFKNFWQIFAERGIVLPKWFTKYDFGDKDKWTLFNTDFLPYHKDDFIEYDCKTFTVSISTPERALFEALYLAPKDVDLDEIAQIFGLSADLKPHYIQRLLETCKSIKVKRLFLYLAEKSNELWFKYLDISKIDLGKGVCVISKTNGHYDNKYRIMIEELSAHYVD
jgi:hypothetical protein